MIRNEPSPRAMGYHMPAEWEPHEAVWLAWPHDTTSFPYLEEAEAAVAHFIREIHDSERVELLVLDTAMRERVAALLRVHRVEMSRLRFHLHDYADIWFRDYGPIFVVNRGARQLALIKWVFNAWGNKYETLLKDNQIPYFMNATMHLPLFEPGIVLEGGSIEVNGRGTLMTTEQCLLNPNRNPSLGKAEIERYLSDFLGVRHFLWLKEGIAGDDTDGHIDDIARFVNPTTVLCARQPDRSDPDHEVLEENFRRLAAATDQDGRKLRLVALPVPGWVGDAQGRLPASYANFYIGNTKVLVPLFGTENDTAALEVIQAVFPDRKVVGISARSLVYGLGTFHCMSQQQPAA
ncbi:MAG TPA: agmatine deiminase family protein [Terriglobia bacterium]|nr:agmatine deiminase family protein [Terriglobia bacterium]